MARLRRDLEEIDSFKRLATYVFIFKLVSISLIFEVNFKFQILKEDKSTLVDNIY